LKVVLSGGGSGGHITPILAVADELKNIDSTTEVIYIGQTGDKLGDIPKAHKSIDKVYSVRAGKFRRFYNEGIKQILDLPVLFKNIRDFFYVIIGIYQSYNLIKRLKPDIVFTRGGFVSVPVALGAKLCGVNYITHDSDPIPSLANRIIARWAIKHAVALPEDVYPYPRDKTITTGIPVNNNFKNVDHKELIRFRKEIDLSPDAKMLFIIGGGLGSLNINNAVCAVADHLLEQFSDLNIYHVAGRANEKEVTQFYKDNLPEEVKSRLKTFSYISDVYKYSGAADLIITRAGATNLAEFALQAKPCIIIPSKFLVGGHQLKNAEYLSDQNAAIVLDEDKLAFNPLTLAKEVSELLKDKKYREDLGLNLSKFAVKNASSVIANLILELGDSAK